MSDSVDRVFVRALNTVRKIPSAAGSTARPPLQDRLQLYGLYKQATEGDAQGLTTDDEDEGTRQKWEAWHTQHGLSQTESKRRYITVLLESMHAYASSTPQARELIKELEFVWDQIKDVSSSDSSVHVMELQQPHVLGATPRRAESPSLQDDAWRREVELALETLKAQVIALQEERALRPQRARRVMWSIRVRS